MKIFKATGVVVGHRIEREYSMGVLRCFVQLGGLKLQLGTVAIPQPTVAELEVDHDTLIACTQKERTLVQLSLEVIE